MRNSKKDYVKSIDECTRMLQKQREDNNKYGKLLLWSERGGVNKGTYGFVIYGAYLYVSDNM